MQTFFGTKSTAHFEDPESYEITEEDQINAKTVSMEVERAFEVRDDILWAIANNKSKQKFLSFADDFEENLANALAETYINQFMRALHIPEEHLKQRYTKYKSSLSSTEYKLRLMTLRSKEDAYAVIKEYKRSRDFSFLARKYSVDKLASQGGLVGWVAESGLTQQTRLIMKSQKPFEISPPIETNEGVHLLIIEDRRNVKAESYSTVKSALKDDYILDMLGEHLVELRRMRQAASAKKLAIHNDSPL